MLCMGWDRWDEECKCVGRSSWNLFLSSWNHGYMACLHPILYSKAISTRDTSFIVRIPDRLGARLRPITHITPESSAPAINTSPASPTDRLVLQLTLDHRHNAPGMFTAP